MKIINSAEVERSEIKKLLQKKSFDEVELPKKFVTLTKISSAKI